MSKKFNPFDEWYKSIDPRNLFHSRSELSECWIAARAASQDDEWVSVKKRLPNKNTRHAGPYGVSVLAFDMDEYKDSGSCTPYHVTFMLKGKGRIKAKQFMQLAYGQKAEWLPAYNITHWKPLPQEPQEALLWLKQKRMSQKKKIKKSNALS